MNDENSSNGMREVVHSELDLVQELTMSQRSFKITVSREGGDAVVVNVVVDSTDGRRLGSLEGQIRFADLVAVSRALGSMLSAAAVALGEAAAKPMSDQAAIRESYPNAYQPWLAEEDEHLLAQFEAGVSVADLAQHFGRQPSAIQSRLAKFGVVVRRTAKKAASTRSEQDERWNDDDVSSWI